MAPELASAPSHPGRTGLVVAGVVVAVAAAACGGFFGWLAQVLYSLEPDLRGLGTNPGAWAGAVSGAAVGVAWSWAMTARARKLLQQGTLRQWRFVMRGALLGLLAGCLSAICVHLAIQHVLGAFDWGGLLVGLAFGAVSGPIVGLLGVPFVLSAARKAFEPR